MIITTTNKHFVT